MNHLLRRIVVALFAIFFILPSMPVYPIYADAPSLLIHILDVRSAAPVTNAVVTVTGTSVAARNSGNGSYRFDTLTAGTYRIEIDADKYDRLVQTVVIGTTAADITVHLNRSDEATQIKPIANVRAVAQDQPDTGTTVHTTLGSESLAQAGAFRLADALIQVPELNATETGYTTQANGPGSSIYMDIRGLGAIETLSMVDGHPIGQGIDLGYNFQNAPIFGLQDVYIGYGTGASGLSSYGTGGGLIDMHTLEPTITPHVRFLQGFGSYGRATTAFSATGTTGNGNIGYAFAYGIEGSNGPLGTQQIYAPTSSWDPSSSEYREGATYTLSQATVRRSFLGKLRFKLGPSSFLTLHALTNDSTADGTGNSDNIYLTPAVALAQGQQYLTNKSGSDPCPTGTFTALNSFGIPDGTGRDGNPDGGTMCQTPQQYAQFNAGWEGYGPHRVTNTLGDYDLRFDTGNGPHQFTADVFTNGYSFYYNRNQFLPYFAEPGDTGFSLMQTVVNTGFSLADHIDLGTQQFGLLYRYLNTASSFAETGTPLQAPFVHENAFAAEDIWSAPNAPLVARVRIDATSSTATNTSFVDPHADVEYRLSSRDRVRLSSGSATVQPPGAWLGLPFVPNPLAEFNAAISCTGLNSIGSSPSSALKPERAYDSDLAYTHDWSHDDYTTVDLYTENLFDKIYDTLAPLGILPANTISPGTLASYQSALQDACGTVSPATLGLTGFVNIGRIQARGIDLVGKQHLSRNLSFVYGWSEESAILRSANLALLQSNYTFILNSQLPNVPLNKASLGLNFQIPGGVDAAFTEYFVSANNPANLPAYNYANAEIGVPAGKNIRLRLIVNNLFNQYAGDEAYAGLGYPLALNGYAPAGSYAAYIGSAATALQNLAPRRIELTMQFGR